MGTRPRAKQPQIQRGFPVDIVRSTNLLQSLAIRAAYLPPDTGERTPTRQAATRMDGRLS